MKSTATVCIDKLPSVNDEERTAYLKRRQRIINGLGKMTKSGRLTEDEAELLRTARDESEFDTALREIRVRHARVHLDVGISDGSLSQNEADGLLDRLRNGEHSGSLRAHVHELPTRIRSDKRTPGGPPPVDGAHEDMA